MITLAIKTDTVLAELYLVDGVTEIGKVTWEAHRSLADTILSKIEELCSESGQSLSNISKVAIYEGPGSYTGLRIGMSVANALGSSLNVPIVAVSGDDWLLDSLSGLNKEQKFATPVYGSEPTITEQKR